MIRDGIKRTTVLLLAALCLFLSACIGNASPAAPAEYAQQTADPEAEAAAVYDSAAALQESGSYAAAWELFSSLGGYRDSAARASACADALAEAEKARSFDEALGLMEAGSWAEARQLFLELGDYDRAADYARRCELAMAQVGDSLFFGSWPQDGSGESQPIEWIVLDRGDDRLLLLSRFALEARQYAPDLYPFWAESPIRAWLNGAFLEAAFSAGEQAQILTVTNSTEDYVSNLGRYLGGPDSEDRLFLLSMTELERCLPERDQRLCSPTELALAQGCAVDGEGVCVWWLRSPGDHHGQVCTVDRLGRIAATGSASRKTVGVRPALWLSCGEEQGG